MPILRQGRAVRLKEGRWHHAAQFSVVVAPSSKVRDLISKYFGDFRQWDDLLRVGDWSRVSWISLAYAFRRSETIEKAEAILLKAREIHPRNVVILVNIASDASVIGRTEEAKARLRQAIDLDKDARRMALDVEESETPTGLAHWPGVYDEPAAIDEGEPCEKSICWNLFPLRHGKDASALPIGTSHTGRDGETRRQQLNVRRIGLAYPVKQVIIAKIGL
jgi:tetratricopeptide (TPR) repeat protein